MVPIIVAPPWACFRRGGCGSEIQEFVYQKWPKNLFPLQNIIFLLRHFLTDLGGESEEGGGGPSLAFSNSTTSQLPSIHKGFRGSTETPPSS